MSTATIDYPIDLGIDFSYESLDSLWRLDGYVYDEAYGPRNPAGLALRCEKVS